jgi:heme-degrading monooxygenase HmoA
MIVRTWMAYAKPENARAYRDHLNTVVAPQLQQVAGFLGVELCEAQQRGEQGERVELLVITRWDSMDAIKAFAGARPDRAVVEPAARALLEDCDQFAFHYTVTLEARGKPQ